MDRDNSDYSLGYRHGSDASLLNTSGVSHREAYFAGFIDGTVDQPQAVIPDWMTPAQVEAINSLYRRNPDGARHRQDFFSRVREHGVCNDRYAGISWCAMFVGIEPDGYTHT